MNFLEGFRELCSGTEIPRTFASWCGLAGVSCVLGRRCFLDCGTFRVYPNEYICLIGASGIVRKSTPIMLVEKLLRQLDPSPNLISQKITPEALITAMKVVETRDPTRLLAMDCTGYIIADELGTMLNKQSYEMGISPVLIQFYDCKDVFEYKTKTSGSESLKDTCLGMLCGTTLIWMNRCIPEDAIGDGLTSRVVFVYEDQPMPGVPFPMFDEAKVTLQGELVQMLYQLLMLEGAFTLTKEAKDVAIEDYHAFRASENGQQMFTNKHLQGYASRRQLHQLKIALLLSACDGPSRKIELRHFQAATALLQITETNLQKVIKIITSNQVGGMIGDIQTLISRQPTRRIKRADLIRFFAHRNTIRELDEAIEVMTQSGMLEARSDGTNLYFNLLTG